ncbi:hypothetical protein JTB14_018042 [Gonioctena quinquepunctata]|nr:hypothetical protein JTB14_018042 [Gonioctena quinquepunctata]
MATVTKLTVNELSKKLNKFPAVDKGQYCYPIAQIEDKSTISVVLDENIRMLILKYDDEQELEKEYEAVEKYLIIYWSKWDFALVNEKN